jgi:hypothetical protein
MENHDVTLLVRMEGGRRSRLESGTNKNEELDFFFLFVRCEHLLTFRH